MKIKILMMGLLAGIGGSSSAQMFSVDWAGDGAAAIIGAPNGTTGLSTVITAWQAPTLYSETGLAGLLGISVATLARADVISFELNGGGAPVGNYESSTWTFVNGAFSQTIVHNETVVAPNPGVVATGTFNQTAYNAFFGTNVSDSPAISWILLDSALDVRDPGFSLAMTPGGAPGEGTPDPDAIGRICVCVPEPSSMVALGVAALAFLRRRRG